MKSLMRLIIQILARLILVGLAVGFLWVSSANWLSQHLAGASTHTGRISRDQARSLLTRALEIQPTNGEAWWYLGNLELEASNLDEAEYAINQALLTFTRHQAHRLYAQLLWTRSIVDARVRFEALEAFDDALAIDPQDVEALNNAAHLALSNFEIDRARAYMDQADHFDIDPTDPRAQNPESLIVRADIAIEDGDFHSARWLVEQVLLLQPDHHRAAFRLAQIESEQFGNSGIAYDILKEHFEPEHWPEYLDLIATLAEDRADYDMLVEIRNAITLRREALDGGEPELDDIFLKVIRGLIAGATNHSHISMRLDAMRTIQYHRQELAESAFNPEAEFASLARLVLHIVIRSGDFDQLLDLQGMLSRELITSSDPSQLIPILRSVTTHLHRRAFDQEGGSAHQESLENLLDLVAQGGYLREQAITVMRDALRMISQQIQSVVADETVLEVIRMVNESLPRLGASGESLEMALLACVRELVNQAIASRDVGRCQMIDNGLSLSGVSNTNAVAQIRSQLAVALGRTAEVQE